jgi:uncharacterized protein (DUF1800 family)
MISQQKKIQHLLLRAGFICSPSQIAGLVGLTTKQVADKLWTDSQVNIPLQSAGNSPGIEKKKDMTKEEKKEYKLKLLTGEKDLNIEWLKSMCTTQSVFREKMTLFWHGHFACHSILPEFNEYLNNQIRQNALGNFGDLLTAVSKSPAMLQYLNNQQNRKMSPNENFAREVMELFTMGRGNYTEDDIKNAARAFTGWRFGMDGQFKFVEWQHDDSSKTFLGETGNFNGDDILKIILQQPATANFIVKKIYRYFVNEEVDEAICATLANNFRQDYDIGRLMYNIFVSDWFYDEKNIGSRIKSPVELLVNIDRVVPIQTANPNAPILVEKVLGQVLFNPPNVAGWKGGKSWIDSSSLMFRLSLPSFIFMQDTVNIAAKEDPEEVEKKMFSKQDEQQMQPQNRLEHKLGRLQATTDWTEFVSAFKDVSDDNLFDAISEYLIQCPNPSFKKETILKYVKKDTKEDYIKTLAITLMSVPEYQMC